MRERQHSSTMNNADEKRFAVRTGLKEVTYLTAEELERSISQEEIQRGLGLAGAWSDVYISEDELFEALDTIRQGNDPAPLIRPE